MRKGSNQQLAGTLLQAGKRDHQAMAMHLSVGAQASKNFLLNTTVGHHGTVQCPGLALPHPTNLHAACCTRTLTAQTQHKKHLVHVLSTKDPATVPKPKLHHLLPAKQTKNPYAQSNLCTMQKQEYGRIKQRHSNALNPVTGALQAHTECQAALTTRLLLLQLSQPGDTFVAAVQSFSLHKAAMLNQHNCCCSSDQVALHTLQKPSNLQDLQPRLTAVTTSTHAQQPLIETHPHQPCPEQATSPRCCRQCRHCCCCSCRRC